jgi:hypothetical protein
VLHLQEFIRGPLNVLPDLVTVSRSIEKRPQDEHVKRSLEETDPLLCLLRHRRHSTLNLAMMVDTRLSIVRDEDRASIADIELGAMMQPRTSAQTAAGTQSVRV